MKPGFKQTEVGVIPEDWEVKPFGLIANIERGKFSARPRNDPKYYGGDIPFLQTGDIAKDHGIIRSFSQTLNDNGLKVSKVFPCGTLFFTIAANIGDVGVATFDAACPDSIVGIRTKQGTEIRWLAYQLATKKGCFEQIATTTTQLNINLEKLRPYLLAIPPYSEQRSIAEALGDADALIESLERLVAKKRDVKQGAMQELLTARRRLPGFKGKWETKTLGQLATIQRGASPRPIDSPIWFDVNSTVGWVRISDVAPLGMYLHATSQKLSELGIRHSRPVDEGSLIMSICATVGRPVITAIDTCIHDGFVVFDRLQVDIRFLYYLLKSLEDTWSKHGQTGSQMNLNTTLINGTAVILPTTQEEQTAIATVLSDMDSELAALEAKLSKARAIKQGMMQELLTGRIRLK